METNRVTPNRPTRRRLFRLAGTLALGAALAACGRKGPLEPPPGSWQAPAGSEKSQPPRTPVQPKNPLLIDKLLN